MATLGQVVCALDEHLFVGRERELALFKTWLTASLAVPAILNVYGLGGVGKSALLRAFRRAAGAAGRSVVTCDPSAFDAIASSRQKRPRSDSLEAIVKELNETGALLLLDGIEEAAARGQLLQEHLLAQLDSTVRVVIATRRPLSQLWHRQDLWHKLVEPLALEGLSPQAARLYLERRGLSDQTDVVDQVLAVMRGHPLGLSLAADLVLHGRLASLEQAPEWRIVMRSLVRRMYEGEDASVRELLEAAAIVRQFDEPTLLTVLGRVADLGGFARLCELSVVQPTVHGLTLHDEVRNILAEDLRWRDPQRYQTLRQRAVAHYRERVLLAPPCERARLLCDRLFVSDNQPLRHVLFGEWRTDDVCVDAGRKGHVDSVRVACENQLAGGAASNADREFLNGVLQQAATQLCVARDRRGSVLGFTALLPLSRAAQPVLQIRPQLAEKVSSYLSVRSSCLPASAGASNVFYHAHVVLDSAPVAPTFAALLQNSIGILAEGGIHFTLTPESAHQTALRMLGFEPVSAPDSNSRDDRNGSTTYVLDLTRSGVDRWVDELSAGQQPTKEAEPDKLERDLRIVLPHWAEDAWIRTSGLWEANMLVSRSPRRNPSVLRETVRMLVTTLLKDATSQEHLAYRALELAYFTPRVSHEAAAERLAVSRATFYRLVRRSVHGLAEAMSNASVAAGSPSDY